jgi:hypothetical protein
MKTKVYILTVLLLFVTVHCLAQSDNYWSWNFNTPSTLLAGSVVGGSAGPSAVFYNPALIDHDNIPSLSLSASLISLKFFRAENLAGEGIDAKKTIAKVQPRFISYIIPKKNERLGMEVAILSPVSDEMRYTIQYFDELDIINRTVGPEQYSGYLKYSRTYDDTWIGFGTSYKLSDNFYIGGSTFLSVKTFEYQYRTLAQAYQESDSVLIGQNMEAVYIAQSSFEEEFKYWFLSLVFKFGGQYTSSNDRFRLGINLTLPNLPIYGQAVVRKTFNRSNIYDDGQGSFTANEIFIELAENEKPRVKNPFSAAIGCQYISKNWKNSISLTVEYFHRIDPYALVDPAFSSGNIPSFFEGKIDASSILSYNYEAKSVSNAAIGFKQYISPSFFFLGGFRTDFTNSTSENARFQGDKFKVNQIHMDKYHFTAGPVLTIKDKFEVITGLQYTFGRKNDFDQVINYSDPVEYIPGTNQALEGIRRQTASARLNEFAFFFGLVVDIRVE